MYYTGDVLRDDIYVAAANAKPEMTKKISGQTEPMLRHISDISPQVGHRQAAARMSDLSLFRMHFLNGGTDTRETS